MQPIIRLLGAAALSLALSSPVLADAALDRIFDTEQLENVKSGTTLAFTHVRETHDPEKLPALERDIEVAVGEKIEGKDARTIIVSFRQDGRDVTLSPFSDDGGNPMLVFFLESVAKGVAEATGGSPFYIKNRIIEAFQRGTEMSDIDLVRDGAPLKATRIVYSPFALEQNKARLQNFANMEVAFILSDKVPGGFVEMRVLDDPNTKDGFRESIVLDGMAEKSE